ncbi:MAG: GFA family protein [Pseudomonadota bacterium]
MTDGCHCGAVSVTLAMKPEYVNLCDCSLCARSGGAWGYYASADVKISGETKAYRRKDYPEPAVEMHFCPTCGTTTHWVTTEHLELDRVGVNMRIFDPAELTGIEARTIYGRNWFGKAAPDHRRNAGKLGVDVFL